MNLFLLDLDPKKCAEYHCDKHIVKMILEVVQMLYSAWGMLEGADGNWRATAPENSYKMTHTKHPISIWIRGGVENYKLACIFGKAFCEEYTRRYEKVHKCQSHLEWLAANPPPSIPQVPLSQMPQAMPEQYKVNNMCGTMDDTVQAYRNYYAGEKLRFSKYKNTPWPSWLHQPTEEEQKKLQNKFKKEQEEKKAGKRKRTSKKKKEEEEEEDEQPAPKSLSSRRKKKKTVIKEKTSSDDGVTSTEVTVKITEEEEDEVEEQKRFDKVLDAAIERISKTKTITTTKTTTLSEQPLNAD